MAQEESTTTTAPATPSGATSAAAATAPAAAATVPADEGKITLTQEQLSERLARAERSALKKLGVEDPTAAKALLDAGRAAEEAKKGADQRAAEAATGKAASDAKASALEAVVRDHAGRELAKLTAEQKAAVEAIAGEDAAAQLKTIDALKPTWAASAAPAAPPATPVAAPPAPKAAPASTAPAPSAPPDGGVSPPDHKATYERLKKENPYVAANYAVTHDKAIWPDG